MSVPTSAPGRVFSDEASAALDQGAILGGVLAVTNEAILDVVGGRAAPQTLTEHAHHLGQVLFENVPAFSLAYLGDTLGSFAAREAVRNHHARAAAFGVGSYACYAAGGAWYGMMNEAGTHGGKVHGLESAVQTAITVMIVGTLFNAWHYIKERIRQP